MGNKSEGEEITMKKSYTVFTCFCIYVFKLKWSSLFSHLTFFTAKKIFLTNDFGTNVWTFGNQGTFTWQVKWPKTVYVV